MIAAKLLENTAIKNKKIDHPAASDIAAYSDKILVSDFNGYVTLYQNDQKVEKWQTSKKNLTCRGAQWLNETSFIAITEDNPLSQNKKSNFGNVVIFDVNSPIADTSFSTKYTKDLKCICPINENLFLTGNGAGRVAFYDKRKDMSKPLFYDNETHQDYIADIGVEGVHGSRYAHCVSGDGTMSTFNLRKNKLYVTSENELDCDYTSICCLDDCSKVIVGSLEGELLTFNYKEYGCSSDRIPGHTGTVDSIIEYNGGPHGSNIVLTAGEDGAIRALNIKPNRYLGIVGQQGNEESILRLCLFGNDHQNELVSLGEDGTVKFWNLDVLDQLEDINSTEKVLGKLKGTASLVGSEKQHFLSKIDKDEIDLPENVESDASSEWEDVIHESTSEEEDS